MVEITKDTIIGDILRIAPDAAPLFLSIGMHCLHCPASQTLLDELNSIIELQA